MRWTTRSFWTTLLGCLVVATSAAAEEPAQEWPEYFAPTVLRDVKGKRGGELKLYPKAYLLHREDFEKISVMGKDLESCSRDLGACEQREVEEIKTPGFWDSTPGLVLKYGLAFGAGVGVTVGIMYAVASPG